MIPTLQLGQFGRRSIPAGLDSDPYWANVVLLLSLDDGNGATSTTDASLNASTITFTGSAALSTAASKFGGCSYKGAASSYMQAALGTGGSMTGDFTVEGWVLAASNNVYWYSTTGGGYLYNDRFQSYGGTNVNLTGLIAASGWRHWMISRVGSTIYAGWNGTITDSQTYAGTVDLQTLQFGRYVPNNNLYFTEYQDEIRITKGVGRYSGSSYTVPTAAFPRS